MKSQKKLNSKYNTYSITDININYYLLNIASHLIMLSTNAQDFIKLLSSERENLIDFIRTHPEIYSHDTLTKILSEINHCSHSNSFGMVKPNNKYVYKYFSGNFPGSEYHNSVIKFLPSQEFVDSMIALAQHFKIETIEEAYSGLGILSALLQEKISNLRLNLKLITSDPFTDSSTCHQMDYIPIAKRTLSDFDYYSKLGEDIPQLLICNHHFSQDDEAHQTGNMTHTSQSDAFFTDELSDLLVKERHDIVIVIMSHTNSTIYETINHIVSVGNYEMYTFHAKIIDRYFYISELLKDMHPTGVLLNVLVKTDLMKKSDKSIQEIISHGIVPSKTIDSYCSYMKWFRYLYRYLPDKLIKDIHRACDFKKSFTHNMKFIKVTQMASNLIQSCGIVNFPNCIYTVEEFLLWGACIVKAGAYAWHSNRDYFLDYYSNIRMINNNNNSDIILTTNLPDWLGNQSQSSLCGFLYLHSIQYQFENWRNSKSIFNNVWSTINSANKKLALGK